MQLTAFSSHLVSGPGPSSARFASTKYPPTTRGERDVVYLIHDDVDSREALLELLCSLELEAVGFASAREYLAHPRENTAACLILDLGLPDIFSLELLRQLKDQVTPPIIFLSNSPNVSDTVSAMKAGAMEVFERPVDAETLRSAIHSAFERHRKTRQREEETMRLKQRLSLLTPREREVLPLVVGGLLNKRAAAVLGISEVTLQIHRSKVMRKMAAESIADLVRMAVKLRIPYFRERQLAQAGTREDHWQIKKEWEHRLVTS